jgi:hypothetical protein
MTSVCRALCLSGMQWHSLSLPPQQQKLETPFRTCIADTPIWSIIFKTIFNIGNMISLLPPACATNYRARLHDLLLPEVNLCICLCYLFVSYNYTCVCRLVFAGFTALCSWKNYCNSTSNRVSWIFASWEFC